MIERLRIGDLVAESGEFDACWRIVDYWRDVVKLEMLNGSRRRRFVYQDEFTNGGRFRIAAHSPTPA